MNKYLSNYDVAYDYFKQSINLCTENSITKGLDIFYSNIGQVLYEMEKYEEAEDYIYKSISLFKKHGAIWGRDIAESYAALIEINKKNIPEAKKHCEKANELARKLNNPKSLKLSDTVKKLLN